MRGGLAGFLVPSLLVHGIAFASLAVPAAPAEDSLRIEAVEFVSITDDGGGRLGNDTMIGDAPEPAPEVPEKIFRQVKPKPKVKKKAAEAKPEAPLPAQDQAVGELAEGESSDAGATSRAVGHAMIRGSAGGDPNATAAGVGTGSEGGIDRRTALRAWLREIQREANKIATRNYPSSAVRQRLEGKLRLGITIGDDGSILGVRLLSSCGHSVLDEAAREAVMALRIPAPPDELGWKAREIALPVRYAID